MDTVVVLFNHDLRVHDHPALAAACADARQVVPVFVADPRTAAGPRADFLAECLADLRTSLRERGGELAVRRGDPVAETVRLARELSAQAVYVSAGVDAPARSRERRLAEECARHRMGFRAFPGVTIVPPDALRPSGGGDHYRVFTPYLRVWTRAERRRVLDAPEKVPVPGELDAGRAESPPLGPYGLRKGEARHGFPRGGETAARERMARWLKWCAEDYAEGHDDLAGNRTSRLSPYLRFGCLSPLELESLAGGAEAFVRQLCWRDFHHQVTLAFPRLDRDDYRPRGTRWCDDEDAVQAWKEGMTGVPIVDAGMRQLLSEGWMHNRARMIVASFLVKRLRVDWRVGAGHFAELLLDGDVASNCGNWQWVAGTGNDTRPNRILNPLRQARRFDPAGEYVRLHLPELAGVPEKAVHEPWRSPFPVPGYPPPLVSLE
ncbi:deoxyribodipyrimidine photo-lyase [Planomonospora sp. ID67723]|uniref:cryptochrome/photolyase family protein n=1 Tax=Planomonospora sp. ID67723 TaxID=2738134 RepID=UPI0018C40DFE|nr:deoxyribodipyrimidine photo-lyase [Planomonospora sp. ID67723]MBG0828279.1 deoxyribodipyrimidine photo-lyase [Planomonospora sp. ID67723]